MAHITYMLRTIRTSNSCEMKKRLDDSTIGLPGIHNADVFNIQIKIYNIDLDFNTKSFLNGFCLFTHERATLFVAIFHTQQYY